MVTGLRREFEKPSFGAVFCCLANILYIEEMKQAKGIHP